MLKWKGETDPTFSHTFVVLDKRNIFADFVVFLEFDEGGDERLRIQTEKSVDYFQSHDKIINEAYKKACEYIQFVDAPIQEDPSDPSKQIPKTQQQFRKVSREIEKLEKRREEITENAKHIEEIIKENFKKALISLHDITQLKLSALLSTEASLRRRAEELEWTNQFVRYQQTLSSPLQMIESLAHHKTMMKEKHDCLDSTLRSSGITLDQVVSDIQMDGMIEVRSNSQSLQGYVLKNHSLTSFRLTFKHLNLGHDEEFHNNQSYDY